MHNALEMSQKEAYTHHQNVVIMQKEVGKMEGNINCFNHFKILRLCFIK